MTADLNAMRELHRILAETLKEAIVNPGVDEDGKPLKPNAAVLNTARQFLRDNNIEAAANPEAHSESKAVRDLAAVLPFAGSK